jgi:hypothetical protein
MATATETRPWQAEILDDLGQDQLDEQVGAFDSHAAVWLPTEGPARLFGTAISELAAIVIAEDKAGQQDDTGEARVVKLDDLQAWSKANAAGDELPAIDGPTLAAAATDTVAKTEDDDPLVDPGGQTAIIDRTQYEREDLQIPKIDDQTVDRIEIKFTGSIFLDRSDVSDVAVYNELRFQRDVSLLIEAKCSNVAAKGATDRDGDLDVVVGSKTLKVHSLSKPAGADWVTDVAAE